jgi:aryl-phospho-beta-D-glucosidase BglC (GH1 family)
MKKFTKKLITIVLTLVMVFSVNGLSDLANAATTMKLSTSKITVVVGKSKTVTLSNAPKGAKVVWSTKDSKTAKVSNGKITGVKAGKTSVICKVTYTSNKKTQTKSFTVAITVTAASTADSTVIKEKSNLTKEHKSANGITTKDNGLMRKDISSQYLIANYMGQGWNLGNSMEASLALGDIADAKTASEFETAWGNVETTQATIDGIHKYGINTVRIPVAWSNMISNDGTYTISDLYFDRVEEIINYCLNDGMYVILNDHFDNGWWCEFGSADKSWRDKAWARYESFWKQIANRYKEYSDRLIFESANEELGDGFNHELDTSTGFRKSTTSTGILTQDQCYALTNEINQKFVDIVRSTGGNNEYRHLLIAGYRTDIDMTTDTRFVMPKDTYNKVIKLSVSVHYYTPNTYCIAESDQGWGYTNTWGTATEIQQMKTNFKKMTKFTKDGYGVMIGEYGVCTAAKDGIPEHYYQVMKDCKEFGYLPIMWDAGLWYDRTTGDFKYNDVLKKILEFTGAKAVIPANAIATGTSTLTLVDESKLIKVYTWEGSWKKNGGSNTGLDGTKVSKEDITKFISTTSVTDGMNLTFNTWGYQAFISPDWSKFTNPCVRVTFKDDDINSVGALVLAYSDKVNGTWYGRSDYSYTTGWSGKCIQLNLTMLKTHKFFMLSFGNEPIITKIEIFDVAK